MTEESCFQDGEDAAYFSIPRGGPIYIPDMVGPLARVSDFEKFVLQELQKLKAAISFDLSEDSQDDIATDELKIIAEEELVNKAFEEAFKEDKETGNPSEAQFPERRMNNDEGSGSKHALSKDAGRGSDASSSYGSLNGSPVEAGDSTKLSGNISTKRKRRGRIARCNNHGLKEPYIEKVEQLAKIKQKQDEDKAAARLHSFKGNCGINEFTVFPSDRTEHMKALKSISATAKAKLSNTCQHVPVFYPEIVLCVEVSHYKRAWSKTQEFLVLGCQPLTQLRDKIYCLTDEVMEKAGQHDSSGYFLIEEVFCNDLRDSSAIDYSKPLFDWLRNSKDEALRKWDCIISGELKEKQRKDLGIEPVLHLPRFRAVEMHTTRFCDLQFRLGAGYLYCHQGDCKHVIVFRDMRLINRDDVQNRAAYPINTFQVKLRFHKCTVCKIYRAEKVTVDDKWAPENPCYFCKNCYYMLHYVNESLLYDEFSVFDYYHE